MEVAKYLKIFKTATQTAAPYVSSFRCRNSHSTQVSRRFLATITRATCQQHTNVHVTSSANDGHETLPPHETLETNQNNTTQRDRFVPRRFRLTRKDEDMLHQDMPAEGSEAAQKIIKQQKMEHKLYNLDNDARRYGRVDPRPLEDYLFLLSTEDTIPSPVALTLLKFCGYYLPMFPAKKRVEMLKRVWNMLETKGFKFDISHYNSLLLLYLDNEHEFSPLDILATLEKNGIEPNRVTFQRLIKRFAQMGDLNGVGTILEHMKSLDMPITEQVCNALLFANIRAKNDKELQSVVDFMQNNGVDLSTDSYYELMCAYAENNDYSSVEKIFQDQPDIVFTDSQIFHLIYIFAKLGHVDHVEKLLDRLRKTTGYVHEALNAALRINSLGNYQLALDILATVSRTKTQAGEYVDFGGSVLQQAMDLEFSLEKVLDLCRLMDERNIHKTALENCYLIACESSNKEKAFHLMEAILKKREGTGTNQSLRQNARLNTDPSLRQQCFWPLVLMNARENNIDGLRKVFGMMFSSSFRVDFQTLAEWMWPYLPADSVKDSSCLEQFRDRLIELSFSKLVVSYFLFKLNAKNGQEAREIIHSHGKHLVYLSAYTGECLLNYMQTTADHETVMEFLTNRQSFMKSSKDVEAVDRFVVVILQNLSFADITIILDEMVKRQIGVSSDFVAKVKNWSQVRSTNVEEHLNKMAEFGQSLIAKCEADTAEADAYQEDEPSLNISTVGRADISTMDPVDISTLDDNALADYVHRASFAVLNRDFSTLLRNQKLDDLLRFNEAITAGEKHLSPPLYVSAMNTFMKAYQPDNALRFLDLTLTYKSSDFIVSSDYVLNLFNALADKNNFRELLFCTDKLAAGSGSTINTWRDSTTGSDRDEGRRSKFTLQDQQQFRAELSNHLLENLLHKLFAVYCNKSAAVSRRKSGTAAESGGQDDDDGSKTLAERLQIFDNLCRYKCFQMNQFHTNFVVDKLMDNNRLDIAVKMFDSLFLHTKKLVKPFKLMQNLAASDKVAELQKVYDCMVEIFGENKATVKLAMALALAGRIKDAQRVLSSPNVRFPPDSILFEASLMYKRKDDKGLQSLIALTKGRHYQTREKLYASLLDIYRDRKDYRSALNVWTTMQEENFTVSKSLLELLSAILKENNQPLPFGTEETFAADDVEGAAHKKPSKSASTLMSRLLDKSTKAPISDNLKSATVQ